MNSERQTRSLPMIDSPDSTTVAGTGNVGRTWVQLGLLTAVALMVASYLVLRFGGLWADIDAGTQTSFIRTVASEGRLSPAGGDTYPNGYAFSAISTYVIALTGLPVSVLQRIIYPFVLVGLTGSAWIAYRGLTGTGRAATLATLLLLIQPEFLFVVLRSTHEKFTLLLMLVCLFALVRSFRERGRMAHLTIWVAVFYVAAYSLTAFNCLLASSFFFALALALALGWILRGRPTGLSARYDLTNRLVLVVGSCLLIVFIFTFYLYAPALDNWWMMPQLLDRVAAMFLDVHEVTDPYAPVRQGWINTLTYFTLTLANWLLLATSLIIWLSQGLKWLLAKKRLESESAWLLWLLYAAFAFQGALSILLDSSGFLVSNLQHRVFPTYAMIAVAVVGGYQAKRRPPRLLRTAMRAGLAVLIAALAILSMLKATNEPALGNKWLFFSRSEIAAIQWADSHLENALIWSGLDDRLRSAYYVMEGMPTHGNKQAFWARDPRIRDVLISNVTRLRSRRIGEPLPHVLDAALTYDNGFAQLHHLRPETPYQR